MIWPINLISDWSYKPISAYVVKVLGPDKRQHIGNEDTNRMDLVNVRENAWHSTAWAFLDRIDVSKDQRSIYTHSNQHAQAHADYAVPLVIAPDGSNDTTADLCTIKHVQVAYSTTRPWCIGYDYHAVPQIGGTIAP